MKKLLLINTCGLVFLVCGALFCDEPPQYDNEPNIEYARTERVRTVVNDAFLDDIIPVIRFEDGDGDLGLTDENLKTAPYNEGNNGINYFIDVLIKRNNAFVPLDLPFSFSGHFFPLSPDGRIGPLEGDLKYKIRFDERTVSRLIKRGDVLKFRIRIRDRALNFSNTVDSDEVVMFVPE